MLNRSSQDCSSPSSSSSFRPATNDLCLVLLHRSYALLFFRHLYSISLKPWRLGGVFFFLLGLLLRSVSMFVSGAPVFVSSVVVVG